MRMKILAIAIAAASMLHSAAEVHSQTQTSHAIATLQHPSCGTWSPGGGAYAVDCPCSGNGGLGPTISFAGTPQIGQTVTITVVSAPLFRPLGYLVLGFPASTPFQLAPGFASCAGSSSPVNALPMQPDLVEPLIYMRPAAGPNFYARPFNYTIPNNSLLVGLQLYAQGFESMLAAPNATPFAPTPVIGFTVA